MNKQQLEVWALNLSNYFIKKKKYQLITFNQDTSEMWLYNPEEKLYPIVLITTQEIGSLNRIEIEHHRVALAMLVKGQAKGLNFSVNPNFEGSDDQNIVVTNNAISNPSLLEYFEGLDQVLEVSGNLKNARQRAMHRVTKNMRRLNKVNFYKSYRVTTIVSLLLVAFFVLSIWMIEKFGISMSAVFVMLGAYYKPMITNANEWWRLLTPMLLHASFIHLFMNLVALRNIASILERELGWKKFLMTLLVGVIYGSIFLFVRDEMVIGIGISAGIYALLGVLFVYLYERDLLKNRRILSNVMSTIFLNVMISLLPNVSFTAHLGGLYIGVILGFLFSRRDDWKLIRQISGFVLSVSTGFLVYLLVRQNIPFQPTSLDLEVIESWHRLGLDKYALRLMKLYFGGSL